MRSPTDSRQKKDQVKKQAQRPSTLSPFRYPGGKSWLRWKVLAWIKTLEHNPDVFVEPFAGGASVGLAVAELKIVKRIIFVERDPDVANVWKVILGKRWAELNKKILSFPVNRKNVLKTLADSDNDNVSKAFRCLLRNRVQRGGILAPSAGLLRKGENGRGLKSRWYPKTLAARITKIHAMRRRIAFIQGDAFALITKHKRRRKYAFFVDPPYTANGKGPGLRLYRFGEINHKRLLKKLSKISGPCLVTYHPTAPIKKLGLALGFKISTTMMKTSHHKKRRELILSKTSL